MLLRARCYFILTLMVNIATSAKILGVFMIDAFSHFNINNAIMETLAMAGHEVTIISSLKPKNPLANITYIQARKKVPKHVSSWSQSDMKSMTLWQFHTLVKKIQLEDCELFIGLQEAKDILASKEKKYDLMFTELIPMNECYNPIAHSQNIPIISTSPIRMRNLYNAKLGNPFHPSVIPHSVSAYESKMTYIQRLRNTIETMYRQFMVTLLINPQVEKFYQKYYPYTDPWIEKSSLIFLNSHSSIHPMPYVPGIIEICGIHLKEPQPLPRHIEKFIRGAEHGVILFSLGSVAIAKDLTNETRQIFRNVFAKIPQRVIWKFGENVDGISDNVMISEWIPQEDILAQENVILFISHVGMSSTVEAIYRGIPILAMPLFGDQINNAATVKELGVGRILDRLTLTEDLLMSSVQELLQNKSYQNNMKILSRAFKDRPMSPKQTVLYWTEYVLRHNGTKHFQTAAVNMPYYHYLLLDVIFFIACSIIVILLVVTYVIKKIYCLRFSSNKKIVYQIQTE